MPRDVRELTNDPDAYTAELVALDELAELPLHRTQPQLDEHGAGRQHGDAAPRHAQRGRRVDGGADLDQLPGGRRSEDLVAVPNPVIHSCQILDDARDVQRIEVFRSETLKEGKTMGFSRSKIVDADNHDRVIAYTEGQGVSIGTPPAGLQKMDLEEPTIVIEDSPDLPPLWEVFGASRRDDGHWILPELAIEMASPDAALHSDLSTSCWRRRPSTSPPDSWAPTSSRSRAGT